MQPAWVFLFIRVNEIMVVSNIFDHHSRIHSYKILAGLDLDRAGAVTG
jgi:hypothetical protein